MPHPDGFLAGMEADVRVHQAAAGRHGLVTIEHARQAGLTDRQRKTRVGAGLLLPVRGRVVRCASNPPTSKQALHAACLALGEDAVASHRSAAWLWDLPIWCPPEPEILVVGRRGVVLNGVVAHHTDTLDPVDRTSRDGIPCTTPSRTLLDLGGVVPLPVVESAMECAMFRGLTSIPRLKWTLDRLGTRGRRGTASLRAILLARDPATAPTQSELESKFERLRRRYNLPKMERQYLVAGMRADFARVPARVAVETDGRIWHSGRVDFQRDRERGNRFNRAGWLLLRYTYADVTRRSAEVASEILDIVHSRESHL